MIAQLQRLFERLEPVSAVQNYVIGTPGFSDPGIHRRTLEKILSIDELPTRQEVIDLIVYSEVVFDADPQLHGQLAPKHLMSYPSDSGINGYLADQGVHHILTSEFVHELARSISHFNSKGQIVEIAAGKGKLSYWLKKNGVQAISSDINPCSHIDECRSGEEMLRHYNPEVVIASWLEIEAGLQREIVKTPSVKYYFEIGCVEGSKTAGVDRNGRWTPDFSREVLVDTQRFSIPINVLYPFGTFNGKYGQVLPEIISFPEKFLLDRPSVFIWTRKK